MRFFKRRSKPKEPAELVEDSFFPIVAFDSEDNYSEIFPTIGELMITIEAHYDVKPEITFFSRNGLPLQLEYYIYQAKCSGAELPPDSSLYRRALIALIENESDLTSSWRPPGFQELKDELGNQGHQ